MNMLSQITNADTDNQDTGSNRWLRPVLVALLVIALAGLGWWMFFAKGEEPAAAPELPVVSVIVPGTSLVPDSIRVTGSIAAKRELPVGVQGSGGMVTAVLVDAGQYVGAGQVLARIDRSVMVQEVAEMAAAVRQSQADAALAQSELERAQTLVAKGFISKADIDRRSATRDSAKARVGVSQANLGAMQARLGQLDVRAPAAGLVLARHVEAGQVVGAGTPALFLIAAGGTLEMRAEVAEQDMARLRSGQAATVRSVGSTIDHEGVIWLLDPMIAMTSRQGVARIALPAAPDLRVGAFANATIAAGEATRPVLPQSAVQADDAGAFVLVVDNKGIVARRAVTLGIVSAKGMAIASGLNGSERVVLTSAAFLRAGEKIKPVVVKSAQ